MINELSQSFYAALKVAKRAQSLNAVSAGNLRSELPPCTPYLLYLLFNQKHKCR